MTSSHTIIKKTIFGTQRVAFGTFISDANGDCEVDLSGFMNCIETATIQHTGSSVVADSPAINESFVGIPPSTNKPTFKIKTTPSKTGLWIALGR
jgi:hypothetical protein